MNNPASLIVSRIKLEADLSALALPESQQP